MSIAVTLNTLLPSVLLVTSVPVALVPTHESTPAASVQVNVGVNVEPCLNAWPGVTPVIAISAPVASGA